MALLFASFALAGFFLAGTFFLGSAFFFGVALGFAGGFFAGLSFLSFLGAEAPSVSFPTPAFSFSPFYLSLLVPPRSLLQRQARNPAPLPAPRLDRRLPFHPLRPGHRP